MGELNKLDEIYKNDVQNEQVVIGYMLQDEEAAILASKVLQEKYFITPYAAHLLKIVQGSTQKGESVADIHMKMSSIADADWKEIAPNLNVKKQEYIAECMTKALPFFGKLAAVDGAFKRIQDQYLRREFIRYISEVQEDSLNTSGEQDIQDLMFDVLGKVNSFIDGSSIVEEKSYNQLLHEELNRKEEVAISTGFSLLDDLIDGLKAGELITVGAGTGVGKSAFAINLILNISEKGFGVALWSFEMSKQEIVQRIFSIKSGLGKKTNRYEERYNASRQYADTARDNISIYTNFIKDLGGFYLQCRKITIQKQTKVVIIDYLQLIHLNQNFGTNRVAEIEFITNKLKSVASELGITIVILSQLSRAYKKRDDTRPILSDLRDSGSIEQDSNIVLFLHKHTEKPMDFKDYEDYVEVIVAKNRSGRVGSMYMKNTGYLTKFEQVAS